MERLFKVKYWDYSSQKFNLNGYICLTSSIAWGFLTLFLTEVIHKPIEHWVLGLSEQTAIIVVSAVTLCFVYDTVPVLCAGSSQPCKGSGCDDPYADGVRGYPGTDGAPAG